MVPNSSQLLLVEETGGQFSVSFGTGLRLRAATPAEALIAAAEIDYADYRRAVERLWDEHPLFEERPIVRVTEPRSMRGVSRADFDDFVAQVEVLPAMLQSIAPVSFLWVRERLWQARQGAVDNGSAVWLLNTGYQLLQILREPFRVQAYLRNILEVTFDGMERASQQERFEKLRRTYPDTAPACDPASLDNTPEGQRVFATRDLFGLYLLELALYFRQEEQRIARCDYCWHYFIPKTKKATRYCDRVTDGQSCKQRGANLARLETAAQDEALLICKSCGIGCMPAYSAGRTRHLLSVANSSPWTTASMRRGARMPVWLEWNICGVNSPPRSSCARSTPLTSCRATRLSRQNWWISKRYGSGELHPISPLTQP